VRVDAPKEKPVRKDNALDWTKVIAVAVGIGTTGDNYTPAFGQELVP
jgi:hypothetical protein